MGEYDSMSPYLNRRSLFIKEIDPSLNKMEIKAELSQVCPRHIGKICVPVDYQTAANLRCAYCNFTTEEDARRALESWRFKLRIRGQAVKIIYAVDNSTRDKVFGPWGLKFFVIVKNLNSFVDAEALYTRFVEFGEIFQCKVSQDNFGQCFGLVQFVEERSVVLAVQSAHKTKFHNSIIIVEPHNKGSAQAVASSSAISSARSPVGFPPLSPVAPLDINGASSSAPRSPPGALLDAYRRSVIVDLPVSPSCLSPHPDPQSPAPYQPNGTVKADGAYAPPSAAPPIPMLALLHQRVNRSWAAQQSHAASSRSGGTGAKSASTVPSGTKAAGNGVHQGKAPGLSMRQAAQIVCSHVDRLAEMLCCPITQEVFSEPVVAADGHTYEKRAIEDWLQSHDTSPMTNDVLPHKFLLPNSLVKALVHDFASC